MNIVTQFYVMTARRDVAAAREALRRYQAKEPCFDNMPETITHAHHLGAMLAHVGMLANSLENLIGEVTP